MRTRLQLVADRRSAAARHDLAQQLARLADDAGVSGRDLATTAGVSRSYLGRILAGEALPSLETYQRRGAALGADLGTRFYANTGPPIRDRFAAPMLEHTLTVAHPRWSPFSEVRVTRPARGVIDLALHEPRERVLVASEMQSELRRLEQLVRWQTMKADSLPSWQGFAGLGDPAPRIGRLLIVRRTRATRSVATEFAGQLRLAYPAHPDDALAALTGTAPWPGDALLWMILDARGARFASGR